MITRLNSKSHPSNRFKDDMRDFYKQNPDVKKQEWAETETNWFTPILQTITSHFNFYRALDLAHA